jgi:hypothetical protein
MQEWKGSKGSNLHANDGGGGDDDNIRVYLRTKFRIRYFNYERELTIDWIRLHDKEFHNFLSLLG